MHVGCNKRDFSNFTSFIRTSAPIGAWKYDFLALLEILQIDVQTDRPTSDQNKCEREVAFVK